MLRALILAAHRVTQDMGLDHVQPFAGTSVEILGHIGTTRPAVVTERLLPSSTLRGQGPTTRNFTATWAMEA